MDRRQRLIEVFEDTQQLYKHNAQLANAVQEAKNATKLYEANDYPSIEKTATSEGTIAVTKRKTFEAAMGIYSQHSNWKIAVLNFASATNPGGGVKTGSSAQEESLCRCSTLYPTLTQNWLWDQFYGKNRQTHDNLHTDACIYSPGVVICKTDDTWPERMAGNDWVTVDVISCAAPNLRMRPGNHHNPEYGSTPTILPEALYKLHKKRAEHILHIAAARHVDALIIGAFGCGVFANDPNVVARAFKDAVSEYARYYRNIEFAVYCRSNETKNFDAFKKILLNHNDK